MAGQPGFFDTDERLRALSAAGDPLERLAAVVDFELFRPDLEAALARGDRSRGGRPPDDAGGQWRGGGGAAARRRCHPEAARSSGKVIRCRCLPNCGRLPECCTHVVYCERLRPLTTLMRIGSCIFLRLL